MKPLVGAVQLTRMSFPLMAAVTPEGTPGGTILIAVAGSVQPLAPAAFTVRTRYWYSVSPRLLVWMKSVSAPVTLAVSRTVEPETPYSIS